MKAKAIIIRSKGRCEVRCAKCGKLLFNYKEIVDNVDKVVDKTKPNVIIVARCTRNDCKTDNQVIL